MFKVFYIEDENGKYISEDGSKRWTRLTGQALYNFLQTEKGKSTYFFVDTDDNGISVGIETKSKGKQTILESDKRRKRYIYDVQKQLEFTTVSFDYFETEDGISSGDEVIPNNDDSVEAIVFRRIEFETLYKALSSLAEDEYALICALYLQEKPLTEREFSRETGVPQKTINDRKSRILKKLKSFF